MSTATVKHQTSKDEAEIRTLVERIHQAHHSKDAAAIAAPYAKDAAIFNLAPPLSHRGVDLEEKKAWLDTWDGPIDCESRDLSITVSGDIAFCHGFYRLSPHFSHLIRGSGKTGRKAESGVGFLI
jgi:ketosteroid isomerase-like protein